jgi:hypothetical protein
MIYRSNNIENKKAVSAIPV